MTPCFTESCIGEQPWHDVLTQWTNQKCVKMRILFGKMKIF